MNITASSEMGAVNVIIDTFPDVCPHCHHALSPHHLTSFLHRDRISLYLTFYCTLRTCKEFFVALYYRQHDNQAGPVTNARAAAMKEVDSYRFDQTFLGTVKEQDFDEAISVISPRFIEIHRQAVIAESSKLDQIAGMGYRKALEFLVKDYVIFIKPQEKAKVLIEKLGNCIKNYVDSARIRDVAERAAWLGNDEAHYMKKWVDKDIKDLKELLEITVLFIVSEDRYKKIVAEMPKK